MYIIYICSAVTDFFGIFFTLSWVFYQNEYIHGDFLKEFNILGQVWVYKVFIAILPPIGVVMTGFFGFGFWIIWLWLILGSDGFYNCCGTSYLWLSFGMKIFILYYHQ